MLLLLQLLQTEVAPPEELHAKLLQGVRALGLSPSRTDDFIALVNSNKERALFFTMGQEILYGLIDVQTTLKMLSEGWWLVSRMYFASTQCQTAALVHLMPSVAVQVRGFSLYCSS